MNDLCSRFLEVLDSEVDTFWSFSCYMEKFSRDFRADGLHRKIGEKSQTVQSKLLSCVSSTTSDLLIVLAVLCPTTAGNFWKFKLNHYLLWPAVLTLVMASFFEWNWTQLSSSDLSLVKSFLCAISETFISLFFWDTVCLMFCSTTHTYLQNECLKVSHAWILQINISEKIVFVNRLIQFMSIELCLTSYRTGSSSLEGTGPSTLYSFDERQHGELHILPQVGL